MKTAYTHIILNGERLTKEAISHRIAEGLNNQSDWEKELFLFLEEWLNDADFVTAQTSGSTGEPKDIRLSKQIMVKSALRTVQYFGLNQADRLLLCLPCRYIAGKMMVVRAIVGGMNLVTVDPATDFGFLQHQTFDFGAMVPLQVAKVLDMPSGAANLENIRNLLIGGSAISEQLEHRVRPLKSRVVITYGMTETASHIAIRELSGAHQSDLYHCLGGIEVSADDRGCLRIDHPDFAEPLQTNDIAEITGKTAFRIAGRADSVIISGGIKYQPEAIEKKLEGLLSRQFVISSVADEKLGQKLVLVIEGDAFDTRQIQKKMQQVLSKYEIPQGIFFLQKLPETDSGKVKRAEIKRLI